MRRERHPHPDRGKPDDMDGLLRSVKRYIANRPPPKPPKKKPEWTEEEKADWHRRKDPMPHRNRKPF